MFKHQSLIRTTYTQQAAQFAGQYNSVTTEQVLPGLVERLPVPSALDVGCGSGRDAKWMAENGFKVDAIDISEGMLREASITNAHPRVSYFLDKLPQLRRVRQTGQRYDVILLSAVWMHLKDAERPLALRNLLGVANPGAVMLITLRHGPSPADRPMFEVSAEELRRLAARELIEYEHVVDAAGGDKLGRSAVWWDNVWLKTPEKNEETLGLIKRRILNGRMASTYKPVLLMGVVKALQTQGATPWDAARMEIPFSAVAQNWLTVC